MELARRERGTVDGSTDRERLYKPNTGTHFYGFRIKTLAQPSKIGLGEKTITLKINFHDRLAFRNQELHSDFFQRSGKELAPRP